MQSIRHALVGVGLLSLVACGGKEINVDIVLSSTDNTNSLREISKRLQTGTSAGVYFILDELKSPPKSITDLLEGGNVVNDPNPSGIGNDPLQNTFKLSTSSLRSQSFYRIRLIAKDMSGNITHTGTGDCPLKVSLEDQNKIKICFGVNNPSNPPLCAGLTSFNNCPGL